MIRLRWFDAAARIEPSPETRPSGPSGFARVPPQYVQRHGKLARRRHQTEPLGDTTHLPIRARRTVFVEILLAEASQTLLGIIEMGCELLNEVPRRQAVEPPGGRLEVPGTGTGTMGTLSGSLPESVGRVTHSSGDSGSNIFPRLSRKGGMSRGSPRWVGPAPSRPC